MPDFPTPTMLTPAPGTPTLANRLAMRDRPPGAPLLRQEWGDLLFMHWPVPAELLQPHLPPRLQIDTYDGMAWLAVVPFRMSKVRTRVSPPVPGANEFLELNVRTYVHLDGVPGVWFFSLDATNALAVWAARTFFNLPYLRATMSLESPNPQLRQFKAERKHSGMPEATFRATWTIGAPLPPPEPDSLAFFLTERYCLYASNKACTKLYRGRVAHAPWPLHAANVLHYESTLLESHGLPTPEGLPLVNAGGSVSVELWPMQRV
ncbi:YqjF family protein [Hymenobacter sp. B1770]|uniref:YqjF family protein n=1 Tax=Hymenobacter sp. B1770 TaxID=1718788 RepID=UPI003CF682B1